MQIACGVQSHRKESYISRKSDSRYMTEYRDHLLQVVFFFVGKITVFITTKKILYNENINMEDIL